MITPEDFPPDRPFPLEKKRALQAVFAGSAAVLEQRSRRKMRITIGSVGAAVVLGGGGAIAYSVVASNSVTDESSARCYTVAAYSTGGNFPGTSIAAAGIANTPGRVISAIDVCASLWRAGLLQAGVTSPVRNAHQAAYPIPALVGCVMANGQAAVFPGTTATCAHFGLVAVASRPARP